MKRHSYCHAACAASALAIFIGCGDDGFTPYAVPNEIVLSRPIVDPSEKTITLNAFYNGEDAAIADACFLLNPGEKRLEADWADGKATTRLEGIRPGEEFSFNFIVETVGGNLVRAEEDRFFSFSAPHDFKVSVTKSLTARIVRISYDGADEFVVGASLSVINAQGEVMDRVPEVLCEGGMVRALFRFDEWPEGLYTTRLKLLLMTGEILETDSFTLAMMPLPETVTLNPVVIDDETGTFFFSASYDGEDSTVSGVAFTITDKDGNTLETLPAEYGGRTASASVSGYPYGRYYVTCTLDLVDGTTLTDGPNTFVHARPRTYASLFLDPIEMGKAGLPTKDPGSKAAPVTVSYLGYDWETLYVYARTSSGKTTLFCSSKYHGTLENVQPFANGIRSVSFDHNSSKDLGKFLVWGKADAEADWVRIPVPSKAGKEGNKYAHVFDLSGDVYRYFKIEVNGSELKAYGLTVEYYVEAPDEF